MTDIEKLYMWEEDETLDNPDKVDFKRNICEYSRTHPE